MKNNMPQIKPYDLEKLICLAKIVAKPWVIATSVLSVLLGASIAANVYMATQSYEITVEQDNNFSSYNVNKNER